MDCITYPMRPTSGGPLHLRQPYDDAWRLEPKLNGERLVVHVDYESGTSTVWNRQGRLSSHRSIWEKAMHRLVQITRESFITWWDCEGLGLRHAVGRGTLILLDWIPSTPDVHPAWAQRKAFLASLAWDRSHVTPWSGHLVNADRLTVLPDWNDAEARTAIVAMQAQNAQCGAELYEGVVAKRKDSRYPIQLRSPDETNPYWIKHRWHF